ncbi:hypothetical protein [Rubinisphaera margarita]|uniref:hypothetical protein n=1 Tax=Rubinisphaera margarita TaxID=2909586 RepID=UPI001EE97729|nr:hypothetical protein [Rubinisphaera margarita]MCG6157174.1 hypothetical protein [Rubinisphaera margarita]
MGTLKVRLRTVLALSAVCLCANVAFAQNTPQRQELFENLLRSLIESRMEDSQQSQQFYGPPTNRPGNQSQAFRTQINQFTQEASRLFDVLTTDVYQNLGLKTHLNPTLEVQAQAMVLSQLSDRGTEWTMLRNEFQTLDRDWRLLSYRLKATSGLSNAARTSVTRLDELDKQLCTLFEVSPQIDQREFLRLTDSLQTDLRNLFDDISIELGRTQQARELLVQGRLIEQQVRFMASAIDVQQSRETALSEFKKFHDLWGPFASQLWPLRNRYIERSLQRIEQTDRELHELLWLEVQVDNRQLTRLTESLTNDFDRLFKATTLSQLMTLKDRDVIIRVAPDLNAANNRLSQSIKENRPMQQLQSEYRTMEQKWRQLETAYRTCTESDILRLVKSTDLTIASMQDALQLKTSFDRTRAMQLLASLENFGEHLQERFSADVLTNTRYNRKFSIQGLHTCQQFTAFARNIHYDLSEGANPDELRARCDTLVRGWNYLNDEYIHKLEGSERERLNRLGSQITPLIVQLQTMFEI